MKAEIGVYPKDRQLLYETLPIDTPLDIDFYVSNVCNYKCNYCVQSEPTEVFARAGLKKEFMGMDIFSLAVEQIKGFPHKVKQIVLAGAGEPTLNKDLPAMIRKIRQADITETVMVITNASTLTPAYSRELLDAGLQVLRISLQGLTAKKYMEISQAKIDWDEYYGNIRYFSEIKGDCKLKVKIADTALEPGDEEKFYSLFGDISDAVAVEHIFDLHALFGKVYDAAEFVETDKTRFGHALRDVKICWIPFIRMVIHPDGGVEPCYAMKTQSPKNLREVPLPEQWNCNALARLRESILQHDLSSYPPCQTCHVPIQEYHPEDILDGHEEEILSRMRDSGLLGG